MNKLSIIKYLKQNNPLKLNNNYNKNAERISKSCEKKMIDKKNKKNKIININNNKINEYFKDNTDEYKFYKTIKNNIFQYNTQIKTAILTI